MFSEPLLKFRRSLSLRLALWFTALFLAASGILFGLLYWRLTATIESREQSALEKRLDQLVEVYLARGLNGLRSEIDRESPGAFQTGSFIRLVTPFDDLTLAKVPDDWIQLRQAAVALPGGRFRRSEPVQVLRMPRDAERDFILGVRQLDDGTILQLGRITENRAALFRPLRTTFLWLGALLICTAAAGGLLVARRAIHPIREATVTARKILATGDLTARVPAPKRADELAELTHLFNTLLNRNQTLIGSLRDALDNVAHDLRTPLTRLRITAEQAIANSPDAPAASRDALADCIEESDRILRILNTLMEVSELEAGAVALRIETLNPNDLLAEVAELYSHVAEDRQIRLGILPGNVPTIAADRIRIRQAVANLVDNAIKYTPAGGSVELATSPGDSPGSIKIIVRDTGEGIHPGEHDRIWNRLYRSERSRSQRGLGLGLSLVKAMVEAHHGIVGLKSSPGKGSEFSIQLPLHPQNSSVSKPESATRRSRESPAP